MDKAGKDQMFEYFRKNDPVATALNIGAHYAGSGKNAHEVTTFIEKLIEYFTAGGFTNKPMRIPDTTIKAFSKR